MSEHQTKEGQNIVKINPWKAFDTDEKQKSSNNKLHRRSLTKRLAGVRNACQCGGKMFLISHSQTDTNSAVNSKVFVISGKFS